MLRKVASTLFQVDLSTETLKSLINFLVPFVALEFILLRVLMRTGPAFPESKVVETLFQWLVFVGEIALNMAFLSSSAALFLTALILTRNDSKSVVSLSALIFSVLLVGLLLYIAPSQIASLAYSLLSFSVFVLVTLIFRRQNQHRVRFLFPVILAYFCSYYFKAAFSVAGLGGGLSLPLASKVFSMGELLALVGAVLAFFVFKPKWNLSAVIIASCVTTAFVAASRSVYVALLSTWALYFTLHLPIWAYAIALWLYAYVIVDLLKRTQHRQLAYGLLLIALGGRMLQVTYLNQLALLGFLLLTLPLLSRLNPHRTPLRHPQIELRVSGTT